MVVWFLSRMENLAECAPDALLGSSLSSSVPKGRKSSFPPSFPHILHSGIKDVILDILELKRHPG